MTEEKKPAPSCPTDGGCPLCQCLWPKSNVGKVIVLVVLVGVLAFVLWRNVFSPREVEPQPEPTEVSRMLSEGMSLYQARRFGEARATFEKVLEKKPDAPLALNYLGILAENRQEYDKALAYFERAAEVDENTPQHFYAAARIYCDQMKDYKTAEERLQVAMKLGFNVKYHMLYSVCAIRRGLPDEVIVPRLKTTVDAASQQVHALKKEDLSPDGVFATIWMGATKELAARGSDYGTVKLKTLAEKTKDTDVKAFAEGVLARIEKERE